MSFKEITQLRKEGKLEEALTFAQEDYNKEPENIWNKRSLSWVYYEFAKKAATEGNINSFLENVQKIKDLQMPSEEKIVFNTLIWEYRKLLASTKVGEKVDFQKANSLYQSLKGMHFTFPSKEFSVLLTALHNVFKESYQYTEVMGKCIQYLRPEDFLPEVYNDRKLMPLAERIYYAYGKNILKGEPTSNSFGGIGYNVDKEKVRDFLPILDSWIEAHPEYTFLPYYKAKMELLLGDTDTLTTFLPFAKKKKNDFWVWQLLSEIVIDKEKEFACLCKALTLKTPESFLGRVRTSLAKLLIEKQLYNEVRTEIEAVLNEKQESGHKVPNQLQQWQQESWYAQAQLLNDNKALYNKYKGQAEAILYEDIPQEVIVLSYVNQEKKIANFVKNKEKQGYFKYDKILKNPQVGQVLKVRMEVFDEEKNAYTLLTTQEDKMATCEALKEQEAVLNIKASGIGFVGDIFVSQQLIEKNNWINGQLVKLTALLSYDKKKGKWGWTAI
nr:hypothetical protein [uncultured Capnocytophaga sp.]